MKVISKGSKYQIYNIGTNKETNIKNLVFMIAKYLKVKLKINFVKGHIGGTKRRCPNISKIQKLGYKPKVTLKEGLKKTVSWYLKKQLKKFMKIKNKSFKIKKCRICSSKKLFEYIDLGNQPPSNSFVKKRYF